MNDVSSPPLVTFPHLPHLLLTSIKLGDSGVGKTSVLLRYVTEEFQEDQANTIGVDLKIKSIKVGDANINLTIWDTGKPPLGTWHDVKRRRY